jgi:hypothetical protein
MVFSGAKAHIDSAGSCGAAEQLAEKVGVATEAFAAAKAGRSFCSLSGTTEVVPCYKAPLKRVFPQAVKSCPVTKHLSRGFSASCEVFLCYKAPLKRFFRTL